MPLAFLRWPVVLAIVVLFVLLRLRHARSFAWAFACFASIYAFVRFGFVTPIPFSVVVIYMFITTLALTAYVSSSAVRREEFLAPLVALVNEDRMRPLLAAASAGSSTSTATSSGRRRCSLTSATSGPRNSSRRTALELT